MDLGLVAERFDQIILLPRCGSQIELADEILERADEAERHHQQHTYLNEHAEPVVFMRVLTGA